MSTNIVFINKEASIRKIKSLMVEKNISEKDMAHKIAVNIKTVRNWFSGKTFPKTTNWIAMTILFDAPLLDLIVYDKVPQHQ